MLSAGAASVSITPDVGAPLAGFSSRRGGATGVHDELHAKALVISNGEAHVALIAADVLAFDAAFASAVRGRVAAALGCPRHAVLLTATHTHSGPVTLTTFFNPEQPPDLASLERLEDGVLKAVERAALDLRPSRLVFGVDAVRATGRNRRSRDGLPVDDEVTAFGIQSRSGDLRHCLLHYACHPTTLGPANLLFSGDFPGFATRALEARLGPSSVAAFANGAMGDVSVEGASELTAIGIVRTPRTFDRACEIGEKVACSALRALEQPTSLAGSGLASTAVTVDLPFKKLPSTRDARGMLEEAERALKDAELAQASDADLRMMRMRRLYASITQYWTRLATRVGRSAIGVELQAIRIGGLVLVAAPVEAFVRLGLTVKEESRARCLLVGPANGYLGYLPTADGHEQAGYEVVASPFAPAAEGRFVEAAVRLQADLLSANR